VHYIAFAGLAVNDDRPIHVLSPAKRFVEFSDVQIVHKFAGRVTPNLDFKVTIFFIFFRIMYLQTLECFVLTRK